MIVRTLYQENTDCYRDMNAKRTIGLPHVPGHFEVGRIEDEKWYRNAERSVPEFKEVALSDGGTFFSFIVGGEGEKEGIALVQDLYNDYVAVTPIIGFPNGQTNITVACKLKQRENV